jgi:choline dehydrogenase-like flavoprotein
MIFDVIVVGTGAGGATVAKELSKEELKVLILEKGKSYPAGTAVNHIKNVPIDFKLKKNLIKNPEYDFLKYSPELMYIEGIGGTTTVSLANACYSCSACYYNSAISQLENHDLNLFEELIEASGDLKVSPLPSPFMGPATLKIAKTGEKLGFIVESMPKFIDFNKCDNCGLCIMGCTKGAKWDATHFIDEASANGATVQWDFEVLKVIHENEIVMGIEGKTVDGEIKKFEASNVVLAAGSLNTPQILINSGVTDGVGEGLFVDLFITVGGYLKDIRLNKEIPMGVKSEFGPYFLSPHFSNQLVSFIQEKGFPACAEDVLGIMVKIADEANGSLRSDGVIEKPLTKRDLNLLKEGYDKTVRILVEAGVDESSIVSTPIRGAHPGGTAAMGRVVNKSMETGIKGLFISDASVIPRAPGRPPILTITAISKSVAKNIIQEIKNKKSNKANVYSDVTSH